MIETRVATVYYAPTAGRRYFTKRAAINAEARALIERRYPTEPFEPDTGWQFHWRDLDNSEKLFRRVRRLVERQPRKNRRTER